MSRYNHGTSGFIIILSVLFFPPLGVFLLMGCGHEVLVAIGLSILGWFPGVFYAMYLFLETGGYNNTTAIRRVSHAKDRYRGSRTGFAARNGTGAPAAREPAKSTTRPVPPPRRNSTNPLAGVQVQVDTQISTTLASAAPKTLQHAPMRKTMRDSVPAPQRRVQSVAKPVRPAKPLNLVLGEAPVNKAHTEILSKPESQVVTSTGAHEEVVDQVPAMSAEKETTKDRVSEFFGGILGQGPAQTNQILQKTAAGTSPAAAPTTKSPRTSPAPGTPGQSGIVNPQITSIKAVKSVPEGP